MACAVLETYRVTENLLGYCKLTELLETYWVTEKLLGLLFIYLALPENLLGY